MGFIVIVSFSAVGAIHESPVVRKTYKLWRAFKERPYVRNI